MELVFSTEVKIHATARDRFAAWARVQGESYAELKLKLVMAHGKPAGAVQHENRIWFWAFGGTFVSYVLKDKPLAGVPFLLQRTVIVTDIRAY